MMRLRGRGRGRGQGGNGGMHDKEYVNASGFDLKMQTELAA